MNQSEFTRILKLKNGEFVEAIYQAILKREVDAAGRGAMLDALKSGVPRRKLMLGLMVSKEGQKNKASFAEVQALIEAGQVSVFSRVERAVLGVLHPQGFLRRLKPRRRLLAVWTTLKRYLPADKAIVAVKSPLATGDVSALPLDAELKIPADLSEAAAAIYADLVRRMSASPGQRL